VRSLIIVIICSLISLSAFSQIDSNELINPFYYTQKAKFTGGDDSFSRYLNANVIYPSIAKDEGLEARVIIDFTIDSTGSVSETKVIYTSINGDRNLEDVYGFGQELERVVLNSPKWKPAMQRDKPVSIRMRFTYKFEL
jgi:protein TonB